MKVVKRFKYPPSVVENKNGPKGGGDILSELLSNFSWRKLNIKSPADVWRTEFRARQSMNATDWVVLAKKWQSIVGQALDFEHEVASS